MGFPLVDESCGDGGGVLGLVLELDALGGDLGYLVLLRVSFWGHQPPDQSPNKLS